MDWNGTQNAPNIPNNNLSTSGNINQHPVHISPQMLELWRRTQQGASVVPAPVLTQALQLGPLPNEQYEGLMQQINSLESYIPVIREHLRIRNLAYIGHMAVQQQQVQANPAASRASIHEVSPTTSPRQNMRNTQNSQQAQQFAAHQNHVQQWANNAGSSNIHDYPNYQQGRPQQYVYFTSQEITQQPGSSTSNGHIGQNTGVPRGWANAGPSGAIPQPSVSPQPGAAHPVSVSINANIQRTQPQAANTGPAQTGRSAAQEAAEWEQSLNAIPIDWQSRPSVTQVPPRPHHPPTQAPVAQAIRSAEHPRPGNSQSSAPAPTQGAPSAPSTSNSSHPPNPSLISGSGDALQPPRPQPSFTPNSGLRQAPHVSSPTVQAPRNGPLTTAPKPSTSTAAAAQLPQYRFVHTYQVPPGAQPSISHPSFAQAPQVGIPAQVPQAPNRQPAAPSSSTAGPNTQIPPNPPYAQNVQRKNLVHSFLAALGKRKAPVADIGDPSEGPNKRRTEEGSADTRIQVGQSQYVSAPIAASVPKAKPAPAAAPAPRPASMLVPLPASAPIATSVPKAKPAPAPAPASIPASIPIPVPASAPTAASVPTAKPAPIPASASIPASIPVPVPASAPVPISAPIPAPVAKDATTTSPTLVPGPTGTNAQVNRQDPQSTRADSSKTQEKQKEGIEGAMAVPVASTSSKSVTVAAEELTGAQREKLIAAIISPPGSRPQTVSVPVRAPTAQAPPTSVSVPPAPPAASAALAPPVSSAPSTSAPAPSEITSTSRPKPIAASTRGSQRSGMPIARPVPSQRTVAPTPKKAKAPVEPTIKQEEVEDDEEKFRETFAVWDLRKSGKALQTPRKKKEVINLVTPSSTASPLKGKERAKTAELGSTPVLPLPSDSEPLFLPSSPIVQRQPGGLTAPQSFPHERIKYEDEDGDEKPFMWGPPPGMNRAYIDVPIVNGRGYARHKDKSKSEGKGKQRIREWELREEEGRAALAAVHQWSGEHDDEMLRVVKCRWRKCGAVLQSRAHCLRHVQVMHVGELDDAPDGWEKFCRWEGCTMDSFLTPNILLDHVAWHIRRKWLCRFNNCLRIFDTSERRKAHHFSRHLSWETYKPLVPPLKLSNSVSRRFESPPPLLPERWFTWDRGWYVDVVANPSASDVGSPNMLASVASNGVNSSHPLVPIAPRARDWTSYAAGAGQSQMQEYGFLVPYYPPDFYCGDLRVGLEVLQEEGGYGDGGGEEREQGSPDELLLVAVGGAQG